MLQRLKKRSGEDQKLTLEVEGGKEKIGHAVVILDFRNTDYWTVTGPYDFGLKR